MAATQVCQNNRYKNYNRKNRSRNVDGYSNTSYSSNQKLFHPYQRPKQYNQNLRTDNQHIQPPMYQKRPAEAQLPFPSVIKPVTSKTIDEVIKSLFSSKPSTTTTIPIAQPRKNQSTEPQKKQSPSRNSKPTETLEEPNVQEEWKKYKANNPPLGGFPVRNKPTKSKN